MTNFKRSQKKYVEKSYKISNWRAYEKALEQRGSLHVWISKDVASNWYSKKNGRFCGQQTYSNSLIKTALTIRIVYSLTWRQTRGFIKSIVEIMGLELDVPSHTILSRRAKLLGDFKIHNLDGDTPIDLLIDSTGLGVHPGNQRKISKSRDWRKFHASMDLKSKQIVSVQISSNKARDASKVKKLVNNINQPLKSMRADSAYDDKKVYETVENHNQFRSPRIVIPPRKNAKVSDESSKERNRNIRSRVKIGKKKWGAKSGYNERCMIENGFYRYKKIIGPDLKARTLQGQAVELRMGCRILNLMTSLGMPETSER